MKSKLYQSIYPYLVLITTYKIFESLIHNQILETVNTTIPTEQADFRPNPTPTSTWSRHGNEIPVPANGEGTEG